VSLLHGCRLSAVRMFAYALLSVDVLFYFLHSSQPVAKWGLHFYMCHARCIYIYTRARSRTHTHTRWKKWVFYKSQHNLFMFVLLSWRHVSAFASGHPQVTRYMLFCLRKIYNVSYEIRYVFSEILCRSSFDERHKISLNFNSTYLIS
jgi:hypothetical protein